MPNVNRMSEITSGISTVSDRIRALNKAGFSRSEIAKFLGKRYQHVRNVLVQDEVTRGAKQATQQSSGDEKIPVRLDVQLGPAGRVVIPAPYRSAMQVEEGDRLMARVVDGELRLITPRMSIKLAQKLVRETIPGDDSLADALIEERREEFKRELSDG